MEPVNLYQLTRFVNSDVVLLPARLDVFQLLNKRSKSHTAVKLNFSNTSTVAVTTKQTNGRINKYNVRVFLFVNPAHQISAVSVTAGHALSLGIPLGATAQKHHDSKFVSIMLK